MYCKRYLKVTGVQIKDKKKRVSAVKQDERRMKKLVFPANTACHLGDWRNLYEEAKGESRGCNFSCRKAHKASHLIIRTNSSRSILKDKLHLLGQIKCNLSRNLVIYRGQFVLW